jgi:hypothetical protein
MLLVVSFCLSRFPFLRGNALCNRQFEKTYRAVGMAEAYLDAAGNLVKLKAWIRGLRVKGLGGARAAAAGLDPEKLSI